MTIDKILSNMTLVEKVGQLNQHLYGWECYTKEGSNLVLTEKFKNHVEKYKGLGAIYGLMRADPWSGQNFDNGLTQEESKQLINMVNEYVLSKSPSNILPLIVEEVPHGHQALSSVVYPVNLATAAAFNIDLYSQVLKEQSEYAQTMGINIGLYSGLDICKNTKWGRTEETFGSDPYLASLMSGAIAKNVKAQNLTACLKHFAAQGDPYMGLNSAAVNIGEREFREIHLPPAQVACKNGVDVIMAAYNEIDGIPCHANPKLLTDTLRDELGFEGIVMADGCALNRLMSPNVTVTQAANMALSAGVDLSLWDQVYLEIEAGVKNNDINISLVDRAVTRVLKLKQKLGLLDSQLKLDSTLPNLNQDLNLKLAEESIILQKNTNNYLPLKTDDKILIIGDTYDDLYTYLGDYTAFQEIAKYPALASELVEFNSSCTFVTVKDALELQSFAYNKVVVIGGGSSKREFDMEFDDNGALLTCNTATDCGENADIKSIELPQIQKEICHKLTSMNVDYCFIMIGGRPYALEEIFDNASAIITNYYNGQQGPKALARVLIGQVNPSGKNPITIPKNKGFESFEYNSKQDYRNQSYVQTENKFFGFGHGLSYSEFEYSNFTSEISGNNITFSLEVENLSYLDGLETVQLYVKKSNSLVVKRSKELIGFKKIIVKSKDKTRVDFKVDFDQLNVYGFNHQYEFEDGRYIFSIGTGFENKLEQELYLKKNEVK